MPLSSSELPSDVAPGDLIRATDFNAVVAWLRDLEDRVAGLEGADESVAITAIMPTGPVRIGDTIEILGRNFGFQIGAHRVYFNSTRATAFSSDSGDARLVVTVPNVPGVSEAGTQVILTVGNQTSVATTEITVRPAVTQQEGSLGLLFTGVEIDGEEVTTIPAGSSVDFTYNLESDALLPTTARLTPTVSIPEWQDRLDVFDVEGNLLTTREIDLEPGQQTAFFVQLAVPTNSDGTGFTLAVAIEADDLPTISDSQTFTVGEEVTPTDPAVTAFRINAVRPPSARDGDTLTVAAGQTVNVQLQAEFAGPADGGAHVYTFSAERVGSGNWQVDVPSSFPPYAAPITFTITGPATQLLSFDVRRPAGGAPPQARLICRLRRQEGGQTLESTRQFTVQPG